MARFLFLNKKKYRLFGVFIFFNLFCTPFLAQNISSANTQDTLSEKTAFQTSSQWRPEIDNRADVAIVYGVNGNPSDRSKKASFKERVKSWRDQGYTAHFMTGIAWGSYEDYFLGNWDGKKHFEEGQVQQNGDTIWHGHNVPYIVPSENYIKYFKEVIIKPVIDEGVSSIYLEEPEFWSRAGYSTAFKKEWQNFYGFAWRPQDASAENTWLASKLKYELYYRAIKEVSTFAKAYGKEKGLDVKVYIPTHSLVNYSSWSIVSPEASLASLPSIDGYIAQVWTGTSREPVFYNGNVKERTFENAFLEYGSMVSMTKPTGRKLFFLTDPIEDRKKSWEDYKKNYQATFTAQLLYPSVANYEVMPWPERIYMAPYQVAGSDKKVLIPHEYSTQMQVMINALNTMPVSENKVNGSPGIGVLMGNSLMFQRFPTHDGFEDPRFSNFYGQTLPLVKRGIPVQTVHMENLGYDETLKDINVLVMSYANMKPTSEKVHQQLTDWVNNGGVLIYTGRDDDPYQKVMEWWNMNGNKYKAPAEQLFELLDIDPNSGKNDFMVGKGAVHIIKQNPKEFVMEANGDRNYMAVLKNAYAKEANAGELQFKNNFYLERGPYIIASVMDESVDEKPYTIDRPVIDLFDPKLPVLSRKQITPDNQAFLYDLGAIKNKNKPQVLATAARISEEKVTDESYSFLTKSPVNTVNCMRIYFPKKPLNPIYLYGSKEDDKKNINMKSEWDENSHTFWLQFDNVADGVKIKFNYAHE